MIGMILIRALYLLKPGNWIDPVCLESLDEVGNAVIGDNGCATDLDRQVDKIPLFGVAADWAGSQSSGDVLQRGIPSILPVFSEWSLEQLNHFLVAVGVIAMRSVKLLQKGPRRNLGSVERDELMKQSLPSQPHDVMIR